MPGVDSQLSALLHTVAVCEQEVELRRIALARGPHFTVDAAMWGLDSCALGTLDTGDLFRHFKRGGVQCSLREAATLVWQYDSDADTKLNRKELGRMLLPATDPLLTQIVNDRKMPVRVTKDVIDGVNSVLEKELMYQRLVGSAVRSMLLEPGFTAVGAFRCIDVANSGGVDRYNMRWYLSRGGSVSDRDLDAVYRRWDRDGDGVLSFREFCDALRHPLALIVQERENTPPVAAPKAPIPPSKPVQSLPPVRPAPPLIDWNSHTSALISLFQEQLSLLNDIERFRESLAVCPDFAVEDGFCLLDWRESGDITHRDLKAILEGEGVLCPGDDCELLLTRYIIDGRFTVEAFACMIEPLQYGKKQELCSHVPQRVRKQDRLFVFQPSTKATFLALMKCLLLLERKTEVRRQRLRTRELAPIRLSSVLDTAGRGFWTVTEVWLYSSAYS